VHDGGLMVVENNLAKRVTAIVTYARDSATGWPSHHTIGERISVQSKRMAEDEKFRWEPALDPDSIVIPGLNTVAPTADQIEQIDQLITLKLQVSFIGACLAAALIM